MKKYRGRSFTVEAVRYTGENGAEILEWSGGVGKVYDVLGRFVSVDTLEGVMYCGIGSWVIRRESGEFYLCKNDAFAATYDEVVHESESVPDEPARPVDTTMIRGVLHLVSVLTSVIETHVESHPAVTADAVTSAQAGRALDHLYDLYQQLGEMEAKAVLAAAPAVREVPPDEAKAVLAALSRKTDLE